MQITLKKTIITYIEINKRTCEVIHNTAKHKRLLIQNILLTIAEQVMRFLLVNSESVREGQIFISQIFSRACQCACSSA